MRIKLLAIMCLALFCSSSMIAQEKAQIKGSVKDLDGKSLSYATVVLLNSVDSVIEVFAITNEQGAYEFTGVKNGNYILQCSFLGYRNFSKRLLVSGSKSIDPIVLKKQNKDLKGVDIEAEHVPITIKEDTIEYNSEAFKTQPNANVENLLKKLPGVEVSKDGTVTAHGEQVQKVLVDGKEFFGDDPKIATKNLPADAVEKIQVFDEQSESSQFTGVDDGQRTKAINLILKEGKKSGYFGNATAGYGVPDDVYEAKASVNRFTRATQVSFIGLANNINDQGFSVSDYVSFMGGFRNLMESGLGTFQNGRPTVGISSSLNNGVTDALAGGLNFNYDISKNTEFRSSYFYSKIQNDLKTESNREYFNNTNNYNTIGTLNQESDVDNHRINFKLNHDLTKKADLRFRGKVNYNEGSTSILQSQQSIDSDNVEQNSNESINKGEGDAYDIDLEAKYRQKFSKPGRSVVFELEGALGNDDLQSNLNAVNRYTSFSDTVKQRQSYIQDQMDVGAKVSYVEPLGKDRYLEFNYNYFESETDLDKQFFDIDPDDDTQVLNENLTNEYRNTYRFNRGGLNFRQNREKYNLTIGLAAQESELDGILITSDEKINKKFSNVLPRMRFNYQFGSRKRLRFSYNTDVNEPSITQLQPIVDNSNPLQVYVGNPGLKAEYAHSARARYMAFNQFSFTSFFATLRATYTTNKITNQVSVDTLFAQTSMPVNVDQDLNVSTYLSFDAPIKPLKIKFAVKPSISYNRSVLFINQIKNDLDRTTAVMNFNVGNRKKDKFDIIIGTKYTYGISRYSEERDLDQQYITSNYYADLELALWEGWNVTSSFDYTIYSGESFSETEAIPLWQASVSKIIFKNKKGQVKIRVFDILDQNTGYNRTSNLNYIEEVRSNNIGQYYMLSFTYALSGFKNESGRGWWSKFGSKRG